MQPHTDTVPAATRGPKILFYSGIGATFLGLAILAYTAIVVFASLPANILTQNGEAGADATAGFAYSQEYILQAPASGDYELWEVMDAQSGPYHQQSGTVDVTGPDGGPVAIRRSAVTGSATAGSRRAETIAQFSAAEPGSYTIVVSSRSGTVNASNGTDVILTKDSAAGKTTSAVFNNVWVGLLGLFLLLSGLATAVTGAFWWRSRGR